MGLFDRIFRRSKQRVIYPPDLERQIERAMSGLQSMTAAHDGMWQIGQAAWSIDQDAGTINFTSPKGLLATAAVQIVGTYNTHEGTWLWGWDNPSLEAALTEHSRKVRSFGLERGYEVLTSPTLACPESQCWELTALACMLAEAQGAYRGPAGSVSVFVTFGEVKLSKAP
jgi:hypothetical protein